MPSPRARSAEEALADAVLDRALGLRRGQRLAIVSWDHALPWSRRLVEGAYRRGVIPSLLLHDEATFFAVLSTAGAGAIGGGGLPPVDAVVRLEGPADFPRLLGLPAPALDALRTVLRPSRYPGVGRVRTLRLRVADASPVAAERYGVDLAHWRAELVRGSLVPPRQLAALGRALSRQRRGGRHVRIRHANGTDLTLELAPPPAGVETGVPPRHGEAELPAGRWRCPVVPGSAEGIFETNRPAYDRFAADPRALLGRFRFGDGRLREFESDRGAQAFAAFAGTGKGRVRVHALTVGLNPALARAPEILDLAAGTVTLEVRDATPRGRLPRFVFPASLAGADVEIDGRPWIREGALPARASASPVSRRAGRRAPGPSRARARGDASRSARR